MAISRKELLFVAVATMLLSLMVVVTYHSTVYKKGISSIQPRLASQVSRSLSSRQAYTPGNSTPTVKPPPRGPGVKLVSVDNAPKINDSWVLTIRQPEPTLPRPGQRQAPNPDVLDQVVSEINGQPGAVTGPWFVKEAYNSAYSISLFCNEESIPEFLTLSTVVAYGKYIEPETKKLSLDRIVNASQTQQWGLDRVNQRDLPLDGVDLSADAGTGEGVNVYVLDSGIRTTHQEFGGRASADISFIDDGNGVQDCNGHGTHVAGTIGGQTFGIAKQASLHAVRVLGCDGSGSFSAIVGGIDWVTQNHVKPAVASMSIGSAVSPSIDQAIQNSINNGVQFVVSAGNDNVDACTQSPAHVPDAITVGATAITDIRADFSNFGTCVDLFGPGVDILSAGIESDTSTAVKSGTSMATPHVSGVVALFLQRNPDATPQEITQTIVSFASANKVTDPGFNSPNKLLFCPDTGFTGNVSTQPTPSQPVPTETTPSPTQAPQPTTGGECRVNCIETGTLQAPADDFHPGTDGFIQSTNGGRFSAQLVGPQGTDFDLALLVWTDLNVWLEVATSEGVTSNEQIDFNGLPGFYSWRVTAFDGSGSYTLTMNNPA